MITPFDTEETIKGHLAEDLTDPLFFFHGLESTPFGSKFVELQKHFPQVQAPDFQGMDIEARLTKAEEVTRGLTNISVVGSSMGGLLAALLFERYPERFKGYLLIVPALHLVRAKEIKQVPSIAIILHGTLDDVVPLSSSLDFGRKFGVPVVQTEDGHRMHNSFEEMVSLTQQFLVSP